MAGSGQEQVYQAFLAASGQQASEMAQVGYALQSVVAELGAVRQEASAPVVKESKSGAQASGGGVESTVAQVLKSGLGVAPLIGGLISLFSGGDETPPPVVKYALPPSVNFQAAETKWGITTADYNQSGGARGYPAPAASGGGGTGAAAASQITVNVNAMDARSFLDRSGDIALAVRDAMLNLNSINDVVNDL